MSGIRGGLAIGSTPRRARASRRSKIYGIWGFGACAAAVFLAGPAHANGRFPASSQIVFSPADPNQVIVRTTYGIFLSGDSGQSWQFLCEQPLGLPSTASEDPTLAVTGGGALVAALSTPTAGLDVSGDRGCSWTCVGGGLAGFAVIDLAIRPGAPHHVVALAAAPRQGDGGASFQAFESGDDGATWAPVGPPLSGDELVLTTIDVAPSDDHRLYVSGTNGFGPERGAYLFAWSDEAGDWAARAITAFDPAQEASIYIGAVDPNDPDRVYLRTDGEFTGGVSRLFVVDVGASGDGGAPDAAFAAPPSLTFSVPGNNLQPPGEMLGFALSPDGSKVYAGSKEAGLMVASSSDLAFRPVSSKAVECLAARGSELWMCSNEPSGFLVGVSTDDGATFAPRLHLCDVPAALSCPAGGAAGPFACGADAGPSSCASALATLGASVGCPVNASDDGGTAAPVASAPSSSSCGCTTPARGGAGASLIGVLLALALGWRRARS